MNFFLYPFEKVMCGSYAYNRITNISFYGKLRTEENTKYAGETERE